VAQAQVKIVWTELAQAHLHAAYDYIAADNERAAESTLEKIISVAEHLSRHPRLGHVGRLENTRELTIPGVPYIVVYRLQPKALEILAVFHAARKWPDEF
jgi:addiction module RelE/StbE family toxin